MGKNGAQEGLSSELSPMGRLKIQVKKKKSESLSFENSIRCRSTQDDLCLCQLRMVRWVFAVLLAAISVSSSID